MARRYAQRMVDDDGWQVPFDQAVDVVVEMFNDGTATLVLESSEGEIGVWDFPGFPTEDECVGAGAHRREAERSGGTVCLHRQCDAGNDCRERSGGELTDLTNEGLSER